MTTRKLPSSDQVVIYNIGIFSSTWKNCAGLAYLQSAPWIWLCCDCLWLYYHWILLWLNPASFALPSPLPMVSSLRCFTGSWAYSALIPSAKLVTCSSLLGSVPYLKVFVEEEEMALGTSMPDILWHFWFLLCNTFFSIDAFGSCMRDSWVDSLTPFILVGVIRTYLGSSHIKERALLQRPIGPSSCGILLGKLKWFVCSAAAFS